MAGRWRSDGEQHQGARGYQEDSWAATQLADGGILAIVADGMGGHAGGAVASRLAVDSFVATVRQGGTLAEGLQQANSTIGREAAARRDLAGMGATLLGVRVDGDALDWISVGDSPLFLISEGTIERLNADHSMAPQIDQMVKRGLISAEEGANHPARHTLREAVMGEALTLIDEGHRVLRPGDRLLLCSDGVQTLSDDEIAGLAARPARQLVAAVLAIAAPHQDNVTVVKLERLP